MNRKSDPKNNDETQHQRSAHLRVGLLAGLVLGLAIAAQQITGDPLGMLIVVIGMHIAGYYAARESQAETRRAALRAGMLGGLIAGVVTGLAFAAVTMFLSLDTTRTAQMQQQSLQAMDELWPSYSEIVRSEMTRDPEQFRISYMISTAIATTCCSIMLPAAGAAFGTVGGTFGIRRRDAAE